MNVGDWIAGTAHLGEIEEALYLRLLLAYYAREGPLPTDVGACARLARASSKDARKTVDSLLREFFYLEADGWHHKRADEEIARFYDKSAKAKASAAVSAEVRRKRANAERTPSERISERSADAHADAELPMTHDPVPMTHDETLSPVSVVPPRPGNLSAATWDGWLRHLREKGKPATPTQERLMLAKLAEHADPDAVVQTAIANGWRYLDPPGRTPQGQAPPRPKTLRERGAENMDIITGRARNGRDGTTVDGTAERVDRAAVLPLARDLRDPARRDVGDGEPGCTDRDVA